MIRSRISVKALGLLGIVLGLMAISASSALASGTWLILTKLPSEENGGSVVNSGGEFEGEVDGASASLLSEINGNKVEFLCTGGTISGAKLESPGKVSTGAKVNFTGCITKVNGTTQGACEPSSGLGKGTIETEKGHALVVLHELAGGVKDEVVQILPDEGETFARIKTGAECSIGANVPVLGKLFLKDCEGKFLEHLVKHLVVEGPLTELFTINNTKMEHLSTLDGSAWIFLKGTGFAGHAYAAHAS